VCRFPRCYFSSFVDWSFIDFVLYTSFFSFSYIFGRFPGGAYLRTHHHFPLRGHRPRFHLPRILRLRGACASPRSVPLTLGVGLCSHGLLFTLSVLSSVVFCNPLDSLLSFFLLVFMAWSVFFSFGSMVQERSSSYCLSASSDPSPS